jgi:hypothetical protein
VLGSKTVNSAAVPSVMVTGVTSLCLQQAEIFVALPEKLGVGKHNS